MAINQNAAQRKGQASYKRMLRMEHCARLENLLWKDADIAAHLNMSPAGLAQLKGDPEYPAVRNRIKTGVISQLDEELKDDFNYQREKIRSMMPVALDGLLELAMQTKNERVRLGACAEIMDRDGRLAKVSRIGLPTEDQGGVGSSIDDETADALIQALKISKATSAESTQSKISDPSITTKVQ